MRVTVDIRGTTSKQLDQHFNQLVPKVVRDAQIAAINKTTALIKTAAAREISSSANIKPQGLIKTRTKQFKAKKNRLTGGVYFNYSPMPAETLAGKGGVRWNRKSKGIRIKGRFYEGAFAATPRAGKHANKRVRVYIRDGNTGSNRRDLIAQYEMLDGQKAKLIAIGKRITDERLQTLFIEQFNWRMGKSST